MERKATAVWQGGLKDGKGTLTTESKVLSNTPYSFVTRFEGAPVTVHGAGRTDDTPDHPHGTAP